MSMSAPVLAWVVSSLTEEQQGAGRDWEGLGGTGRGDWLFVMQFPQDHHHMQGWAWVGGHLCYSLQI